jgi:hypothetical protein
MGILSSHFFEYQSGYVATQIIEPGKAYWAKMDAPGILILQPNSLKIGIKKK